jgi:hypothetical protein
MTFEVGGAGREAPTAREKPRGKRREVRALGAALVLLAGAALAHAGTVPQRVEIVYRVSIGPLNIGEGHDVFEHDGKTYQVTSEAKTTGVAAALYRLSILRESRGRITPKGLRTDSFAELRNGKPKRSGTFDWEKRQAHLVDGESEQTVELPDNTWDTTSFGYNFAFTGLETPPVSANLTDGRRIMHYDYKILGKEGLDTALGRLETVHVQKVQPPGDKRGFDVWVAPGHYNLPVRIRYTEKDGTVFDSVLAQITYPAK